MSVEKRVSKGGLYSSYRECLNSLTGLIEAATWALFAVSVWVMLWPGAARTYLSLEPVLVIDGLARVVWPYVTLITALLMDFSRRYMRGNHRLGFFFVRCLLFLLSVMVLSATDHVLSLLMAWLLMGWFMARLIAHKVDWKQAREAGELALRYFFAGTLFLSLGMILLYVGTDSLRISEILRQVDQLSLTALYIVFFCLLLASTIQSALFPVQNWLMSSMTAPTPASALMHAGFVNVGGILLTRFAGVFADRLELMSLVVLIGALSAIMGKVWKMVQTAIKRQLACSTIAQMGFMLLQCGLGYFSAALSHLMLHGFYKGYLFLNSGTAIEDTTPKTEDKKTVSIARNLVGLLVGLVGGAVFVWMTGKGASLDSGLFLVFIVVLTVLHASREIIDRIGLSSAISTVVFPVVVLVSIVIYASVFNGVTLLLHDLPSVVAPTPFTWVHGLVAAVFLVLWGLIETGVLKKFDGLYVRILNASQPHSKTILSSKEEYHV